MKKNIAVIGYGGQGGWHCKQIMKSDVAQLTGIYDIKQARMDAAVSENIYTYENVDAILRDERVDAVVVATPNDSHKELVVKALEAGKHVICEKPVDVTVEAFDEMCAAAEKNGKLFTVHQNRRWDVDFLAMPRFYLQCENGTALMSDWTKKAHVAKLKAWNEKDVLPVQTAVGITKTMAPRDEVTLDEYDVEKPASDVHDFYRNFCAAMDGKEAQLVTHEQVRRVLKVMVHAFESAKKGQAIEIEEKF